MLYELFNKLHNAPNEMSCDLNLRGVKRKLDDKSVLVDSTDDDCPNQCYEPDNQRRPRLDTITPLSNTTTTTIPSLLEDGVSITTTPSDVTCSDDSYKPLMASSPTSFSSESMSDDDGSDDDDDDEDDDDDYPSDEYAKDQLYLNQTQDDLFGISAESESGYDERVSSNSSDSTSSECEYSTIASCESVSSTSPSSTSLTITSSPSSVYSSQLDLSSLSSSSSSPTYPHQTCSPSSSNQARNSPTPNGFYCSYSMAPSTTTTTTTKSSSHYPHHQTQSYSRNNGRTNGNYLRQRQQLFHMSMSKLARFRQSSDPSLHRSVLICNTLRMLEKELEREGVKVNFGPNGVSFISPVSSPDLDFLPMLQTPSMPSIQSECMPLTDNGPFVGSTSNEHAPYQYASQCDSNLDNNGDYDKYLTVDSGSPSGRATPFVKSFPNNDYSNRVIESNSAFWGNSDEQMSDRLTSLNWSSMLSFSTSTTSTSAADAPTMVDVNTRQHQTSASPSTEVMTTGSMMPYPAEHSHSQPTLLSSTESVVFTSSTSSTSSCANMSPNVSNATFATLLPPASTLTSASSIDQSTSMLVTSSQTASPDSGYTNAVATTYYTASSNTSPTPMYSTNGSLCTSQQSCGNSSVSSSSLNAATSLISSTPYINSYYGATSDEIFGDIDVALYDFDFSPLSPPNITNKSASIMSAEELIRNIPEYDNCMSTSTPPSPLLSINHTVNGFSGQCYTSSNSYPCATNGANTMVSNSQLGQPSMLTTTNQLINNCGSTSTGATGLHLHAASGRYYKTPEERDQQTIATIKCHN